MSTFIRIAVVSLATILSMAAYAGPHGGGGPGGGHFGGGGFGAHFGGGHFGGGHFGGGHFGGGHFGGGHFGGIHFGGAHFGGGGAFGRHFGSAGHFGGTHFGGGHFGGIRFGGAPFRSGRHFGGRPRFHSFASRGSYGHRFFAFHGGAHAGGGALSHYSRGVSFGARNAGARFSGMRNAVNSRSIVGALRNPSTLRDPRARAYITALAATAGWRNELGGSIGWWQHANGGYGWVGPLFWPFAYDDIYDYVMWGYDPSFWGYDYYDLYAGIFAPYAYDDLTGYFSQYPDGYVRHHRRSRASFGAPTADLLREMCGGDSREVGDLPVEAIRQAMRLTDAQRAALDDLANALLKAAQDIAAACPTDVSLTAPNRLATMQQRLEAMIAAVAAVQSPLQKFYDLLDDEQKARFTALGEEERKRSAETRSSGSLTESCDAAQSGVSPWPTAEIDQRVHPTDTQRVSLATLQDAITKATDMLRNTCQPDSSLSPPARLAAVGKRLESMLQAVKTVRPALDDFYATLSDEQKAQFDVIGRRGHRVELFERPRHNHSG